MKTRFRLPCKLCSTEGDRRSSPKVSFSASGTSRKPKCVVLLDPLGLDPEGEESSTGRPVCMEADAAVDLQVTERSKAARRAVRSAMLEAIVS